MKSFPPGPLCKILFRASVLLFALWTSTCQSDADKCKRGSIWKAGLQQTLKDECFLPLFVSRGYSSTQNDSLSVILLRCAMIQKELEQCDKKSRLPTNAPEEII